MVLYAPSHGHCHHCKPERSICAISLFHFYNFFGFVLWVYVSTIIISLYLLRHFGSCWVYVSMYPSIIYLCVIWIITFEINSVAYFFSFFFLSTHSKKRLSIAAASRPRFSSKCMPTDSMCILSMTRTMQPLSRNCMCIFELFLRIYSMYIIYDVCQKTYIHIISKNAWLFSRDFFSLVYFLCFFFSFLSSAVFKSRNSSSSATSPSSQQ